MKIQLVLECGKFKPQDQYYANFADKDNVERSLSGNNLSLCTMWIFLVHPDIVEGDCCPSFTPWQSMFNSDAETVFTNTFEGAVCDITNGCESILDVLGNLDDDNQTYFIQAGAKLQSTDLISECPHCVGNEFVKTRRIALNVSAKILTMIY